MLIHSDHTRTQWKGRLSQLPILSIKPSCSVLQAVHPSLLYLCFGIRDEDASTRSQRAAWRIKWERMRDSNTTLDSLPGEGATSFLFMPVMTSSAESLKTSEMPSISFPRLYVCLSCPGPKASLQGLLHFHNRQKSLHFPAG